jgi:ubiquinone/menaquinone biosynthesis C-methylase UbiE
MNWAHDYFETGYAQRWPLSAPSDQTRREAAALWTLLALTRNDRLIDIGCGHGKYSLAFSELGARVVGLDFAASLLDRARDLTVDLRHETRWTRGDMRHLPFRSGCADAAILLDAFGFFGTDAENDDVLREAARVLRVGGRLALKVVNGALVLADFRPNEREERDGVVVVVVNTLTADPPRLTQRLQVSGRRGAGEYERCQRLYRGDELRAALESMGLDVVALFASLEGEPFDSATSSAMWAIAERR